jgi:hypothetical protein
MIAMALAVVNPYTAYVSRTWDYGYGTLPKGPVVIAFLLVAANGLALRLRSRLGLTRADLIVIYTILTIVASLIVIHLPYSLALSAYPFYRARAEFPWEPYVLDYIPPWLLPTASESVPGFWEGLTTGAAIPWGDWVAPVSAWGGFTLALFAAMFCLGALMRKDWIERQRLSFPLTEIPLAITGQNPQPTLRSSVFGQRAFWAGFLLAGGTLLLWWLNRLFPRVPGPALLYPIGQSFRGAGLPWSALVDVVADISPAVIGVMCLIPVEISFSLWAWFVLFRVFLVVCGGFGIPPLGTEGAGGFAPRSFFDYAGAGGFVMVAAAVLYQSRSAPKAALRALFGRENEEVDLWSPMSNCAALVGFVLANAFMVWWALHAGMSWLAFFLLMAALYPTLIGASRLTAAAGVLFPRPEPDPRSIVLRTVGANAIGPRSLALYSYINMSSLWEPQGLAIHQMMNSFKLLHSARIRGRGFLWAVAAATVGVIIAGSFGVLYASYRHGALTMLCWPITATPLCAFRTLDASLGSPEAADNWLRFAMVAGGGFALVLFKLSARFVWWPLSPIGFIIASVWHTNHRLWASAFIGWLLTAVIRRYGGLRLYRQLRPAFIGLVLGHYLTDAAMALFAAAVLGARGVSSLGR